jgi:phosphate/sulfate permease
LSPVLSGLVSYLLFFFLQKKILDAQNPIESLQKNLPFFAFGSVCLGAYLLSSSIPISLAAGTGAAAAGWLAVGAFVRQPLFASGITGSGFPLEKIFVSLQILTACMVAFAHGANDVANAIGPMAAILNVLQNHTLSSHSTVPSWLLALGGGGIVLGLATWGWRVIETVGKKITSLSPARGFCAEFGAAATILAASKLGLPISTTHALVGAVFGVGLVRGISSLNLQVLKEIALSWIVTIPLCAALSVLSFYLLQFLFL